jgi:hypothetical protein
MSASSGKGLVIATCNSCPGKEADHAPGYTTVDFRISEKVKSLHASDVLPFHDILDAKMVNAALAARRASRSRSESTRRL